MKTLFRVFLEYNRKRNLWQLGINFLAQAVSSSVYRVVHILTYISIPFITPISYSHYENYIHKILLCLSIFIIIFLKSFSKFWIDYYREISSRLYSPTSCFLVFLPNFLECSIFINFTIAPVRHPFRVLDGPLHLLWQRQRLSPSCTILHQVRLGGLGVTCLPQEIHEFFSGRKNPEHKSYRRDFELGVLTEISGSLKNLKPEKNRPLSKI